ncbi:MAG: glycoside hydrolase family 88 protein [Bacteroidales bacterium]
MKIKFKLPVLFLLGTLFYTGSSHTYASEDSLWCERAIKVVEGHALNMLEEVLTTQKLPRSEERGLQPASDWTSGFYPGVLWYLYSYTGCDFWKKNAETVTAYLEKEQYNEDDHDIGFRIYCSYGKGYEFTANEAYKKVIIQSAKSLATRYNPKVQAIQSWHANADKDWMFPVIIDNMMNLELLYKASDFTSDRYFSDIALKHAITTQKNHFRKDFSCPHVVDYNPATGKMRRADYNNGYNDPQKSAWSRGQAWGLYGYTYMYRVTKSKEFLDFAENIAAFILNHPNMPEDLIPYWDFNSPKIPSKRDASAAAINAAALLELSTYPTSSAKYYFETAEKILQTLASEKYLATVGTNGHFAIKHATGNFLAGSELDNTLIYADYYFIEALIRYQKIRKNQSLF